MLPKSAKYRTFQSSRLLSILLITVLLFGFQPVQPARAATITVDTLVDGNDLSCSDGDCSLREAIYSAAADDTIDFSVTGTLTLTLGDLIIDKDLTITGPGAGSLSIWAHSSDRVFYINSGVEVTISGMTITNGSIDYGGGIYNNGTLTVENSTVSGNIASTSGGGIYNSGGSVTLDGSTIYNNGAVDGAGIYSTGTLIVEDSTLSGNSASHNGGGILTPGSLTIQIGSIVGGFRTGNTADLYGRGIFISGSTTTINGSSVSYHGAINGCGIYNLGAGTLIVQNSSFISGGSEPPMCWNGSTGRSNAELAW